jgi:predicted hydrocarbon binding protein
MSFETGQFSWDHLGDIDLGRPNLGNSVSVAVYRLMQFTMRSVLYSRFGGDVTRELLREAGLVAGREFCSNLLDTSLEFNSFIAQLQERLKEMNIGVLRIEQAKPDTMEFLLTVSEDLDCSGIPVSGEAVCEYDEGFLAGLFNEYTGRSFDAQEVDCWATGERTCRFRVWATDTGEVP